MIFWHLLAAWMQCLSACLLTWKLSCEACVWYRIGAAAWLVKFVEFEFFVCNLGEAITDNNCL